MNPKLTLARALDKIVARDWPTLVVPHEIAAFEPLHKPGQRILLAAQGLFLEVRTSFIHAIVPKTGVPLPYGQITPKITLQQIVAKQIRAQFEQYAADCYPMEAAAWATAVPEGAGEQCFVKLAVESASSGHITYRRPARGEYTGELLADIHSHPIGPGEFSRQDDRDDLDSKETRLAMLLDMSQTPPQWLVRVLVAGVPFFEGGTIPIAVGELP